MRHYKKGRKLGTDASHTKAMKKSLVAAILANDRIKTTETRAKEIRPEVDRVITWAKKGDLHSRRLAIAKVGDQELIRELFEKVDQGMFADRPGGYTRIMKLGSRKGDAAPMVIMELVTEPVKGATKAEPAKAAKSQAKPAAKKAADKAQDEKAEAEEKAEEAVESLEAAEDASEAQAAAEEARSAEVAGDSEVVAEEKAEEAVESLNASEEAAEAKAAADEAAADEAAEKAE